MVPVGGSVAIKTGPDGDDVIRGDIILPDVQHVVRRHFLQAKAPGLNEPVQLSHGEDLPVVMRPLLPIQLPSDLDGVRPALLFVLRPGRPLTF